MCPVDQILVGIVLLLMWSTNLPPIQPRFHLLDLCWWCCCHQSLEPSLWFRYPMSNEFISVNYWIEHLRSHNSGVPMDTSAQP